MRKGIILVGLFTIVLFSCGGNLLNDGLNSPGEILSSGDSSDDFGIPRDGLVAEYLFSGNAEDTSGEGNHGVLGAGVAEPTVAEDRFGDLGKAYSFDGGDYVELPDLGNPFVEENGWTISVWMKALDVSAGKKTIIGFHKNAKQYIYVDNGKIYGDWKVDGVGDVPISNDITADEWIHVLYYFDNTSGTKLYLNGVLSASDATVGIMARDVDYNKIGMWSGATQSYYFTGQIDDVRIYNRALNENEIQALYQENCPTMIFWSDQTTKKIQKANLDGSNVEDVVTGLGKPVGIATDTINSKIYWIDYDNQKIQKANFDGSNIEDLITTGLSCPFGLALDIPSGKMYWTDYSPIVKIQRANLDGSNIEDIVTSGNSALRGITLDLNNNKIYWVDTGNNTIKKSNLDGTSIETIISSGPEQPHGIKLDLVNNKIYWTNCHPTDKIQRANLDGSNVEDFITSLNQPVDISIDTVKGEIYWTEAPEGNRIRRVNLDGTGIEDVVTGLGTPTGLSFDK